MIHVLNIYHSFFCLCSLTELKIKYRFFFQDKWSFLIHQRIKNKEELHCMSPCWLQEQLVLFGNDHTGMSTSGHWKYFSLFSFSDILEGKTRTFHLIGDKELMEWVTQHFYSWQDLTSKEQWEIAFKCALGENSKDYVSAGSSISILRKSPKQQGWRQWALSLTHAVSCHVLFCYAEDLTRIVIHRIK